RGDVLLERARRAVGLDPELVVGDLLRQPRDVAYHVRPGAREPDVGSVDPELVHQVEDGELVLDRRTANRRRLEPVAQRLVVELDPERRLLPALAGVVPVVDEVAFFHGARRVGGAPGAGEPEQLIAGYALMASGGAGEAGASQAKAGRPREGRRASIGLGNPCRVVAPAPVSDRPLPGSAPPAPALSTAGPPGSPPGFAGCCARSRADPHRAAPDPLRARAPRSRGNPWRRDSAPAPGSRPAAPRPE